ncbi:hypothetical protein [Hydrogenophaga sp. NFH-34]|uniref:hypothetical protein n=1 Tax=Hydrogenophaga sp. NFH-34 TaxID=2744446 RepID=UPI001F167707|nr:hypothetical protein [Hydrogenophaga sp. NFH-34]
MTAQKRLHKHRKWKITGIALLLAVFLASANWQLLTIWWSIPLRHQNPIPQFDVGKAKSLSTQRRAELERELFSELWMWNTQSRRYQEPGSLEKRRQRWLEMASEGYELAYLTLQVLEPGEPAPSHNPLPIFKRLEELAEQGDAGAMCLYGGIAFQLPIWAVDWTPQKKKAREWMEKGAQLRHPQCLIALGGRLTAGTDGYPKEVKRGSEMIFDAIRKGYLHGAGSLWVDFERRGLEDRANRKLIYCWQYQDAKNSFFDPGLSIDVYKDKFFPEQQAILTQELDRLRQWHPSIDECIELTKSILGG